MQRNRQIGLRVRAYRIEQKLTQEQLAERIDRSVETISNLERGVSVPSEATLNRLAKILGVSVEDLMVEKLGGDRSGKIEFFQSIEILKKLDDRKIKMAYSILKIIGES
ncbi:MAG: putative transcriptional regulator [Rhodospirillales bacterium]|nr:putative transcriptional regulator [Rhodospirillales bacterium]